MTAKLAFVSASWHSDIVDVCRNSFANRLEVIGLSHQIEDYRVAGALEIPLTSQWIAEAGDHDIILACAFVIDGGIYRHEFVASSVINGIVDVQLKTGVPILSAVLTPHHFHDHDQHSKFYSTHMVQKGEELADACSTTLSIAHRLGRPKARVG